MKDTCTSSYTDVCFVDANGPSLPSIQRYGYGGWVQLHHHCKGKARMMKDGQVFRVVEDKCWSPEARLKEMDNTGQ